MRLDAKSFLIVVIIAVTPLLIYYINSTRTEPEKTDFQDLFQELSPILECLEKCSKLRVINGIARGLYTNNECYCVFYTEAFRVKWNESLANSLIEIEGDNITLR